MVPVGGRKPSSGRGQQARAADLRAAQFSARIARRQFQRTPSGALGAGGCVCCRPQSGIVLAGGRSHQGGAGSRLAKRCCRAHQCAFHKTHRAGGRPDRCRCRSSRRSLGRRDPLLRCWCQCPGSRQSPGARARGARALRERRNRRNHGHGKSLLPAALSPRWAGGSSTNWLAPGAGVRSVTYPGPSPARTGLMYARDRSVHISSGMPQTPANRKCARCAGEPVRCPARRRSAFQPMHVPPAGPRVKHRPRPASTGTRRAAYRW